MKRILLLVFAVIAAATAYSRTQTQIITTSEKIADGDWQCFHKEFTLRSADDISLKIAADTKYWLWVNEELVVREGGLKRGPSPTGIKLSKG